MLNVVYLNGTEGLHKRGGASKGSHWTGHVDVNGLKAIGWTDEDITYYQ